MNGGICHACSSSHSLRLVTHSYGHGMVLWHAIWPQSGHKVAPRASPCSSGGATGLAARRRRRRPRTGTLEAHFSASTLLSQCMRRTVAVLRGLSGSPKPGTAQVRPVLLDRGTDSVGGPEWLNELAETLKMACPARVPYLHQATKGGLLALATANSSFPGSQRCPHNATMGTWLLTLQLARTAPR